MVSISEYMDDVLDEFATSPSGIIRIIEKHQLDMMFDMRKIKIQVDMEEMRVILVEEDDYQQLFYIHKIKRV